MRQKTGRSADFSTCEAGRSYCGQTLSCATTPDFEADWKRIETVSQENLKNVRTLLGTDIHLARAEELNGISRTVAAHKVVVIAGESGSGKSSLVSQLVVGGGTFKRILWLTAEQLSKSSQAELAHVFGLRHGIPS